MLTGRAELLAQAANLLPNTSRYDTLNHYGMTALMLAAIRNDEVVTQALLDAGCDPNIEVPGIGCSGSTSTTAGGSGGGVCGSNANNSSAINGNNGSNHINQCNYPAIHQDVQHWTAVTFAAARGNYATLRILLERGGKVEGGAIQCDDKYTLTPLQVACGSCNLDIVNLLLAHGANPFLSTQQKDSMSFAGSAQRGSYCAISVAAAHGQKAILRKLLSTPFNTVSKDVLSLEEMLAEDAAINGIVQSTSNSNTTSTISTTGTSTATTTAADTTTGTGGASGSNELASTLSKTQIKAMQEAMYHSAENNHLGKSLQF